MNSTVFEQPDAHTWATSQFLQTYTVIVPLVLCVDHLPMFLTECEVSTGYEKPFTSYYL